MHIFQKRTPTITDSDVFKIYKIPNSYEDQLNEILISETQKLSENTTMDYFTIHDLNINESDITYRLSGNFSNVLNDFSEKIICSDIRSFLRYTPRLNRDTVPFKGFVLAQKNIDNTFLIGIEPLSDALKVYKKNIFGILNLHKDNYEITDETNYEITDTNSKVLVPKSTSIIIKGTWNIEGIEISEVLLRSNRFQYFENMFEYRTLWDNKLIGIMDNNQWIRIDEEIMSEISGNIQKTRKFVRIMNSIQNMEESKRYISEYCMRCQMDLGFRYNSQNPNDVHVSVSSKQGIVNFLRGIQGNLTQDPFNESLWWGFDHKEPINNSDE
ncbi:hypothetical protein HNP88_000654 [Methanococcus maripaludis]|uniref:Uncharacterized protein n=2 Tax=Methanococcus maripaludis TaxID=39152 RepID=A0A7J9NN39_METMI|nr:hypothetical protein [Methanococcus maripaludis]